MIDVVITGPTPLHGCVTVPADKGIGHRAALIGALGTGTVHIRPWPSADDCASTLAVLEGLGVPITRTAQGVQIQGRSLTGLRAPSGDLPCGESGTTMRLAAGLLAGQPFASRLTAAPSLNQRPMRRIVDPLSRMGARCEGRSAPPPAAPEECYPPLRIEGSRPLKGLTHHLKVASAQVKSAILLAGLYADGPTTIIEPLATRDHTERMLKAVGISIRRSEHTITLEPPTRPLTLPPELILPGDFSSAAFFLVAASIVPGSHLVIADVSLNPTRAHLLDVLTRMGASIQSAVQDQGWPHHLAGRLWRGGSPPGPSGHGQVVGWEPRGTLTVEAAPLHGVTLTPEDAAAMIDELPILMVAACAAKSPTTFTGVQELRVKETDRLRSMTTGLAQLGARIELPGQDQVRILPSPLRGATVDSFGDHRTAMSLAVAGLMAQGQTRIRHAGCVAKSFGAFFEILATLAGSSRVRSD